MRCPLIVRALGGWLCTAIALLAPGLPAGPADAQTPVKVGYLKEPFNINVVKLSDFVDGKKVAIELVPFRQFAEVGRALQAGEILTGWRLAMGIAWVLVVVSEMVAVKSGLGFTLWDAYYYARMDIIVCAMLSIGVLGYACDWALKVLDRRLTAWARA